MHDPSMLDSEIGRNETGMTTMVFPDFARPHHPMTLLDVDVTTADPILLLEINAQGTQIAIRISCKLIAAHEQRLLAPLRA